MFNHLFKPSTSITNSVWQIGRKIMRTFSLGWKAIFLSLHLSRLKGRFEIDFQSSNSTNFVFCCFWKIFCNKKIKISFLYIRKILFLSQFLSFSTPVFLSSIIDEENPNTESQSGDLSVPSEIVRAVFRHFRSAKRNDIEAGKMNWKARSVNNN